MALQVALDLDPDRVAPIAVSVSERLTGRGGPGDEVLAEDLLAAVRRTPPAARTLEVDLDELGYELGGNPEEPAGYLDLRTGEVIPDTLTDPAWVGEDAYVDIEEEPERWLPLERRGSRDGWRDMADFAAGVRDERTRHRLESAIEGRGAFRRFRDAIGEEGLLDAWRSFSDERKIGRGRDYLAAEGIRARPPRRVR